MLAEVRNYARSRAFPTHVGNLFLRGMGQCTYVEDPKAIEELRAFPNIGVKILDDGDSVMAQEVPRIDYSVYPIYELRSIAASLEIKGFFTMTKAELIKNLQEKNNATK